MSRLIVPTSNGSAAFEGEKEIPQSATKANILKVGQQLSVRRNNESASLQEYKGMRCKNRGRAGLSTG